MNLYYDSDLPADRPEPRQTESNFQDELREALIAFCRLPSDAVSNIEETMRASQMTFCDAAVHTGLVTEHEAADASAWVRERARPRESAIIETALRRRGGDTNQALTTVRHAGHGHACARLAIAHRSDSAHAERIRALRTELLLLNEIDRQASCVAVLSPCAGEGRSQLTAELAIAFAQLGRSTLLVDADLRKPGQHELFGLQSQWGLAQSLTFGQSAELFGVEGLPHLTVVPAGPPSPHPTELLAGDRLNLLITRWRHSYDFIFIDTPPVSLNSEAISVAALAGGTLVVGRAQRTPYELLKETIHRLRLTQTRVLGAIIGDF